MKKMLYSLFASPDRLLQVMRHCEIQDSIEDGDQCCVVFDCGVGSGVSGTGAE